MVLLPSGFHVGFKAKMDPLLVYCVKKIKDSTWCYTCLPLSGHILEHMSTQVHMSSKLINTSQS